MKALEWFDSTPLSHAFIWPGLRIQALSLRNSIAKVRLLHGLLNIYGIFVNSVDDNHTILHG